MAKIILYGVGSVQLRRDIEFFLDDSHEILGYSDTYYESDVLDGRYFIRPQDIPYQKFDYILLLHFQVNVLDEMKDNLLRYGVEEGKIIEPSVFFHNGAEKCQLDLVADILEHFDDQEGLIFGLSYSRRAIRPDLLKDSFYDCSWAGLDIYYNLRLFQYLEAHKCLSAVKTGLLLFPYYYFDYDMSKSSRQYESGQIFSVCQLNDWHNYKSLPSARSFVINYQLFGRKLLSFYRMRRYELQSRRVYQGKDNEATLSQIWFRSYPETVAENKVLLAELLRSLAENNIKPILIIPPLYINGLEETSKEAFFQKKERFFLALQEVQQSTGVVKVLDCAELFAANRSYFMDLTHLNSVGAKAFTDYINRKLFS